MPGQQHLSAYQSQSLYEYVMRLASKVEEMHFTADNPLTVVVVEAAEQARLRRAGLEGGIILSRVYRTTERLRILAGHLKDTLTETDLSSSQTTEVGG